MGLFSLDAFELGPLLKAMALRGGVGAGVRGDRRAHRAVHGHPRLHRGGEKVLQGFLAAYLSLGERFTFRSEAEYGKGYADLSLEPDLARYPDTRHGYLIELKYLKRGEPADGARLEALRAEAAGQLRRYLSEERLGRQFPGVTFTGLALVFHGWELVGSEAITV